MQVLQIRFLVPTDVPVAVGISITKTLAKLANWSSKKWKAKIGAVVDLYCPVKQEKRRCG